MLSDEDGAVTEAISDLTFYYLLDSLTTHMLRGTSLDEFVNSIAQGCGSL